MLLFCISNYCFSQIIAGAGASGLLITDPMINLSVSSVGNSDTGMIDLDCDSVGDIRVILYKGPTVVDGANMAYLTILNPGFEICADTGYVDFSPVHFYNAGDTITSPAGTSWSNDSLLKLGDFGCMDCQGPASVSNLYIAYRNISTLQTGWIKISFFLTVSGGPAPVTLSIPEVLSPCSYTACTVSSGTSGTATCGIFTFNYSIVQPTCSGTCDGSISITGLSGGTPTYTYLWNDPSSQTTAVATSLCAGVYTITFTDATGTSCTYTFVINNPASPVFSFVVTNATCHGACDGSICVTGITGGTGPYTYMWSPGGSTGSCIINACAGTYYFVLTDANGCNATGFATVYEPSAIMPNETVSDASCSTCCDGSASISPLGGTPGYTYLWSNGQVGSTITGSCEGTYGFCITDMNGCNTCDSVTVSFPLSVKNYENISFSGIFPNPNKGVFTIAFELMEAEKINVELKNTLGQTIKTMENRFYLKGKNHIEVQEDELSNGIYFIKIQSGTEIINYKFIKE
jgi:hypothetical protein